jgi:thiamine-phosphate pyrophosphorylase
MTAKQLSRILDANLNRSREGLRVCEEVARFVLEDDKLTKKLKKSRHSVSDAIRKTPKAYLELLSARDTAGDIGRKPSKLEKKRQDSYDLFAANIERAKESLRVLEESYKLLNCGLSDRFKKIRFEVYAIEKLALPELEALRHHR